MEEIPASIAESKLDLTKWPSIAPVALSSEGVIAYACLPPWSSFSSPAAICSSSGSHRQRSEVIVGSTGTVFPHGYGRDSTPFVYTLLPPGMQELVLECVVDEQLGEVVGCGLMNIEEGAARAGDTVEERADVFFRKVESF